MHLKSNAALWASCLLLAACSASGSATGLVTESGQAVGKARFLWKTDGGDTARLIAVLPDGERFVGPAVAKSMRTDPGVSFVVGSRQRDSKMVIPTDGKVWTGEITATLIGDRGRSMQCELVEHRPGLGLEGGASGTCRVSDGRDVAVNL